MDLQADLDLCCLHMPEVTFSHGTQPIYSTTCIYFGLFSGIIPANEETEIAVTFAPVEFQTAYMRIQLVISQYNSQPIVCTFTGTSVPGLLK